jgi:uncharacterized protein YjiS (DUF1127 family)
MPAEGEIEMATYDVCETQTRAVPAASGPLHFVVPLLEVWATMRERIAERRAIHQLYQLDEHVLRDMGFDPAAIYAAREGAIGEWKSRWCGE